MSSSYMEFLDISDTPALIAHTEVKGLKSSQKDQFLANCRVVQVQVAQLSQRDLSVLVITVGSCHKCTHSQ